jgi:hypothetical protein
MPELPAFSLYANGIGSVEMLSGQGVSWPEIEDLIAGEDDGNERLLAAKVRKALEATRR